MSKFGWQESHACDAKCCLLFVLGKPGSLEDDVLGIGRPVLKLCLSALDS